MTIHQRANEILTKPTSPEVAAVAQAVEERLIQIEEEIQYKRVEAVGRVFDMGLGRQ